MLQSRGFAPFMIWAAVFVFALGLLNLVINTAEPASWAPLLILVPLPFVEGARRLRVRGRRSGSAEPGR